MNRFLKIKNERIYNKIVSIGTLSGVVYYLASLFVLGSIREDYSHIRNFVSELGEIDSPHSMVLNFALIISGIMLFLFAYRLHKSISNGEGSKLGPIFLGYFGFAVLIGGLFPCDEGCIELRTLSGYMHAVIGLPVMIANPASFLLFTKRMRLDPNWSSLASFSKVCGIIIIPLFIASATIFPMLDLIGLGQRLTIVFQLLWVSVIAIKLFSLK